MVGGEPERVQRERMTNPMTNQAIADVFWEMADLLDIQGGDDFRVRAHRRIARTVESLPHPVARLLARNELAQTPGIGDGGVRRIKDILRTGTCDTLRKLRAAVPAGLVEARKVRGVGPRTLRAAYQNLGVTNVDQLEAAAIRGQLVRLPGVSPKMQTEILMAIPRYRRRHRRTPLHVALEAAKEVAQALAELSETVDAKVAGSARRRKETIGDLDVLVAADDPFPVATRFLTLPQVSEVLVAGSTRASVRIVTGHQVDLRVLPPEEFGAGLHYFTGSQQHNVYLRARAMRMGMRISDHGVYRRSDERRILTGRTEEEIFAAVGCQYIPPEIRENTGEIEAAAAGKLPRLVQEEELRGDLHVHTAVGLGSASAAEMVDAAAALGSAYVAITDRYEHAARDWAGYVGALRELAVAVAGRIRVIVGVEVPIEANGTLAAAAERLADCDWVVGRVVGGFDLPAETQTRRLLGAVGSGLVDAIAHPTGRVLGEREAAGVDIDAFLRACHQHRVVPLVAADPRMLDLDATGCRRAQGLAVPVGIGSDARAPAELANRRFGTFVARRGWLTARDVLNTQPLDALFAWRARRLAGHGVAWTPPELGGPSGATSLTETLRAGPLRPELITRLQGFLMGGGDPELEAALSQLGAPNALQAAFQLLGSAGPKV